MAEPVDSHNASALADQFLRQLYTRIAAMLHPHHREHEPGGIDPLRLPLGSLVDVTITSPVVGQVIICSTANDAEGTWVNGAAGAGSGMHGVHVGLAGPISVGSVPPGPVNPFDVSLTIKSVFVYADDAVTVTVAGETLTLGAGAAARARPA